MNHVLPAEYVRVLRPSPPDADFNYAPLVQPIFDCVERRLIAQDQDQEVKECAITCMGLALCHLGDACAEELPTVLPILLDRLRNEITRITAVKAFAALAAAKLDMQLGTPLAGGTVLHAAVAELCTFLRKSNRPLRQASLTALTTIVSSHHAQLSRQVVEAMLDELPAVRTSCKPAACPLRSGLTRARSSPQLVTDADLHVAHLARLRLTEEELGVFTRQLGAVLEHAQDVEALQLDGIEPMSHPFPLENVTRKDEVGGMLDREEVLDQAPATEDGRFQVPQILGEQP